MTRVDHEGGAIQRQLGGDAGQTLPGHGRHDPIVRPVDRDAAELEARLRAERVVDPTIGLVGPAVDDEGRRGDGHERAEDLAARDRDEVERRALRLVRHGDGQQVAGRLAGQRAGQRPGSSARSPPIVPEPDHVGIGDDIGGGGHGRGHRRRRRVDGRDGGVRLDDHPDPGAGPIGARLQRDDLASGGRELEPMRAALGVARDLGRRLGSEGHRQVPGPRALDEHADASGGIRDGQTAAGARGRLRELGRRDVGEQVPARPSLRSGPGQAARSGTSAACRSRGATTGRRAP